MQLLKAASTAFLSNISMEAPTIDNLVLIYSMDSSSLIPSKL
jgi:hypothetical protein